MLNLNWSRNKSEFSEKNRVSSFRGYLLKMKRNNNLLTPQWGKRWFSIEGRFLKWYRHDSDLCSSGMVDLKYVRSITKVDHVNFCFELACQDRYLYLRASSLSEMNNWVRALHIQADIARGGTGMNIVSDFNEKPLKSTGMSVQSMKSSKSRSSFTIEQELEMNLQKLDELEKSLDLNKISSPREKKSSSKTRSKMVKKSIGDKLESNIIKEKKSLKSEISRINSDFSIEESSRPNTSPGKLKTPPNVSSKDLFRVESIESLSIDNSPSSNLDRLNSIENNPPRGRNYSLDENPVQGTTKLENRTRIVLNEDEFSDEFEFSSDFERGSGNKKANFHMNNNTSATKNFKSKFLKTFSEDSDDGEFNYVPDVDENLIYTNQKSSKKIQGRKENNNQSINKMKSAWVTP